MKPFSSHDGGGVAIYAALGLATFMGVGALAVDIGRFMHLHTDLQSAADASALAGAAELNGEPALASGMLGARARAEAAARNALFANTQTFATDGGGAVVAVNSVEFLSSLTPVTAATSDANAAYIRVTVAERTVTGALIRPLLGEQNLTTSASAVAGMDQVACSIPPLWMCGPGGSDPLGVNLEPGQLVLLKAQGGQMNSLLPGNFGLLETPEDSQSTKDVTELLASTAYPGCHLRTDVKLKPGQAMNTSNGINVRFDIYKNNNFKKYQPDRNVSKGVVKNNLTCPAATQSAAAMPIDDSFSSGCGSLIGNGNWDRAAYWEANHPGILPPANLNTMTRYELYQHELEENRHIAPACGLAGLDDRRIMHIAVIDCGAVVGDRAKVKAFARFFITRPMIDHDDDKCGKSNLWAEFIDVARAGDDDAIHNIIQLYR